MIRDADGSILRIDSCGDVLPYYLAGCPFLCVEIDRFTEVVGVPVLFKKTNENAIMPTKAHDDDFCYDSTDIEIILFGQLICCLFIDVCSLALFNFAKCTFSTNIQIVSGQSFISLSKREQKSYRFERLLLIISTKVHSPAAESKRYFLS